MIRLAPLAKLDCGRVLHDKFDGRGNPQLIFITDESAPHRVPPCRKYGGGHGVILTAVLVNRGADDEFVEARRPS